MPRIPQLRVIIEAEPNTGSWNMAVDNTLLNTAISSDIATLRWYRWSEPTVSLGYFQKSSEFRDDAVLSQLPNVRRMTGGGAILHDDEWTYSIALPSSQRLCHNPEDLYDVIHQALISGLQKLGYPARFRGETVKRADEPLLCFLRQDAHDVVLDGHKIIGSAQRRRKGAILQHGSLIRKASQWAKQLPGLVDLLPHHLPENLERELSDRLAQALADSWDASSLTTFEIEMAGRFCQQVSINLR